MRFFSKLTFICNICFIAAVLYRFADVANQENAHLNALMPLDPFQGSIVLLGYGSILINFIFILFALLGKKGVVAHSYSQGIFWANLFFLPLQIGYFFFFNM